MNRDTALALAAVGAAAVIVFLASPLSPLAKQTNRTEGYQGVTWSPRGPAAHHTRGGLFHPPAAGEGRTGLICWGWDWIASPPGEAQPGLGVDGSA